MIDGHLEALQLAVRAHEIGTSDRDDNVLDTARKFAEFIQGDN